MSVLTPTNLSFILQGLWLTIYISFISIILSTLIGTVLAVMRNGKNPVLHLENKKNNENPKQVWYVADKFNIDT